MVLGILLGLHLASAKYQIMILTPSDVVINITILIILVMLGGVLGGIARNIFDGNSPLSNKNIALGLFASAVTPLFLKLISSQYFENFFSETNSTKRGESGYILLTLFMSVSFFSENFIFSLKDKLGEFLKKTEESAKRAEKNAEESKKSVSQNIKERILIMLSKLDTIEKTMLFDIICEYGDKEIGLEELYGFFEKQEISNHVQHLNTLIETKFLEFVKTDENKERYYKVLSSPILKAELEEEIDKN